MRQTALWSLTTKLAIDQGDRGPNMMDATDGDT